jgi:hypothetical protein
VEPRQVGVGVHRDERLDLPAREGGDGQSHREVPTGTESTDGDLGHVERVGSREDVGEDGEGVVRGGGEGVGGSLAVVCVEDDGGIDDRRSDVRAELEVGPEARKDEPGAGRR